MATIVTSRGEEAAAAVAARLAEHRSKVAAATLPPSLRGQTVDAGKRIAEIDAWQKSHPSQLRAQIEANRRTQPIQPRLHLAARPLPPGLTASQQSDWQRVERLDREVAEAAQEMQAQALGLEERIQLFDEFAEVNRDALKERTVLRKKQANERMSAGSTWQQGQIADRASQTTEDHQRSQLLAAFKARRAAYRHLNPEQRIAAIDEETPAQAYPIQIPLKTSMKTTPIVK